MLLSKSAISRSDEMMSWIDANEMQVLVLRVVKREERNTLDGFTSYAPGVYHHRPERVLGSRCGVRGLYTRGLGRGWEWDINWGLDGFLWEWELELGLGYGERQWSLRGE